MPCNNTSMMLPLAMENSAHHGGGVGALQLPLIQPQSPGKAGPVSPPMRTPSTPISLSNAAVTAAQNAVNQQQNQQSSRYKTELCRPFEEFNVCKYGDKCQFAHGFGELRKMTRHPKYKTELCRTFHTLGLCPYGHRCHFIHNSDEVAPAAQGREGGANAGQNAGTQGPTAKESVAHRSSSMSSSASTSSSSSSTSGLGSGGSSPVYIPHHHGGSPFSAAGTGLTASGLGSEADLYAAAAGLSFGPLAVQAQLVAAAQAQLALNVAAQQAQQHLPPLSPSQSPSFCGSSIPSLSSSPPLSATSSTSAGSHIYAPINFYMETNHRLPVFWNLSP